MRFSNSILFIAMTGLMITGCSADRVSEPQLPMVQPGQEPNHNIDIVKLISTNVTDQNNKETYFQNVYEISAQNRLLLRYKALPSLAARIRADQPLRLRVTLADGQAAAAAAKSLRVCPVTSQWTMSATWLSDGLRDNWTPGGELAMDHCVGPESSTAPSHVPANGASVKPTVDRVALCGGSDVVCFDVSGWYRDFVLAQGSFDGLALISADGQAVRVIGETDAIRGPWLSWSESVAQ